MKFLVPYAGSERAKSYWRRVRPRPEKERVCAKSRKPTPAPTLPDDRPLDIPAMPPLFRTTLLEVCREHGVHPNDVVGESRERELVLARRDYVWRVRDRSAAAWSRIARSINKDRKTVLYAWRMAARQHEAGASCPAPARH